MKKPVEELRLDGQTPEEWGRELFETELCSECGGDFEDHDIIPFMGHWFARCKKVTNNDKSPISNSPRR